METAVCLQSLYGNEKYEFVNDQGNQGKRRRMHLDWCWIGAHCQAFCMHAALFGLEYIHGYALAWVSW
jgi:hypothetical protein